MVGAVKLGAGTRCAGLLCALVACALLSGCGSGPRVCTPPMYLYNGVCVVDFEGGVDAGLDAGVDAHEGGSQDGAPDDSAGDTTRAEAGADAACGAGMHRCGMQCTADDSIAGCGATCEVCTAPLGASATCASGHCSWTCDPGFEQQGTAGCDVRAPRPIAPLSTATTTSQRPTFQWALGMGTDGARIEICQTRACPPSDVVMSVDFRGTRGALPANLRPGVWFWRLRGRVGSATGLATSPVWQFTVGSRSAALDTSWGTTLDVNGDGYADVVVGASGVLSDAGAAYVYLGSAAGLGATPTTTLSGPDGAGGGFGNAIASAGDVNGDGYADVVVGAPGAASFAGRAYLYLGGPAGLAATPAATLTGSDGGFGAAVASAGDVNGDGYGDLVVGAWAVMSNAGRAYVYLGGAAGLALARTTLDGPDGPEGAFGWSVASAGDVNGDGYGDIVVGARGAMSAVGRTYVYHGGSAGLAAMPAATLTGPDGTGGSFGFAVATAGDVNGDGYADVVIGASGAMSSIGRAYIYLGGAAGLAATPRATLGGPDGAGGQFGGAVASAGDVNGDGYADVVVGAGNAASAAGRAYVYLGAATGLAATPTTTLSAPDGATGEFGYAVGHAGDVNGDGYSEIVVGAYAFMTNTGRAYIYYGGSAGLAMAPATTLTGPDGAGGYFGSAVANAQRVTDDHAAHRVLCAAHCGPAQRTTTCTLRPLSCQRFRASSGGVPGARLHAALVEPADEPAS